MTRHEERLARRRAPAAMECIVVGGVANGLLLRQVKMDAKFIELRRPDHIKPLESSKQQSPEVHHEKDVYEIHPLALHNTGENRPRIFGIAVVQGQTLSWAFSQLVIGYIENVTTKLLRDGLISKQ